MAFFCPQCASQIEPGAAVCVHCEASMTTPQSDDLHSPPTWPVGSPAPDNSALFQPALLDSDRHLEGISGWLILVAIGLVLSPLIILGRTLSVNLPLLTNASYHDFLAAHPALEGMIAFEIATNLIFVAILVALNFLFFTRKKAFPTYMILYLALQLVILVGDAIAARALIPSARSGESYQAILRSLLAACVWIPYLLVSRRVKVTFVQ